MAFRSPFMVVAGAAAIFCSILAHPMSAQATEGELVISEFRYRGPNGANDEFIEIQNVSGSGHTVTALSGTGYGVAASDGLTRCSIPNGTIIPEDGRFLCVNSLGYSLASYPAANGLTATGNDTYTMNIPENAGIAIFNNNTGGASYTLANRIDAVGTTATVNVLYKEGTGLPTLVGFSIDYAWVRDNCGKSGSITTFGPCPQLGATKDTNNNAADFYFVDTNGTSAGGGQRLGAPGPQNLSSPIFGDAALGQELLDVCPGATNNIVRDLTSDPANNSNLGTLDIRHTFTNTTGAPLTNLRFRVVDITTFPAPLGIADLRPRTSASVIVPVDGPVCDAATSNTTVVGTTLEQPPTQANGGGFNSSMRVGTITQVTPLGVGETVSVRFLLGIQQNGSFKISLLPEGFPEAGNAPLLFEGCTSPGCSFSGFAGPFVASIVRAESDPASEGSTVDFTVVFSEPVTGVTPDDFVLTTTGSVAGATITNIAVDGSTYTVSVDSGTGTGTLRLDVVDNDTIIDAALRPLGGPGAANGNYNTGQVYTISDPALVPATVESISKASPDPTEAASVNFTVTFSEAVTGVDAADFTVPTTGTIAGAAITSVSGSGATRTVTVSTGSGDGTLGLNLVDNDTILDADLNPLSGAGAGNGNFTGDVYTVANPPRVVSVVPVGPNPTNSPTADFTVTFSEAVTGVDISDFALVATSPGASITAVAGAGSVYTVSVTTGFNGGGGSVRLDVLDNDSIIDSDANPLGGTGPGNGAFNTGAVLSELAILAVPAVDSSMLAVLAALLAGIAAFTMRRT